MKCSALFKKVTFSVCLFSLGYGAGWAQTPAQLAKIRAASNLKVLYALQERFQEEYTTQRRLIEAWSTRHRQPIRGVDEKGRYFELQRILPDGTPIYYITENLNAAITTRTNTLWNGGSLGLNIEGQGMVAREWDGGGVLNTHQEFGGRVILGDGVTYTGGGGPNHATHVAGTIIAAGVSPNARGMAPQAQLRSFDWNNDKAEMAAEAAAGALVSNHSYGYNSALLPRWMFGFYNSEAADWDNITYNAPYYLPLKAAGNDRGAGYNSGDGGYDLITGAATAKNVLVVAAVDDVLSYTGPGSVIMSSFSSWGPTDDGRIKPDISANGVNVYSSVGPANTNYATYSGTSMATPNATGTLLLLQQYYASLNAGNFMRSATLRGLVIHTADEAGPAPGPDYSFGWGLLNAEKAALTIRDAATTGGALIEERTLNNGGSYVFNVTALGWAPLEVTICWTDPAGTPPSSGTEDPANLMLVNDLDIRVSDGVTTYYPWRLNPASPTAAATTGDNFRDNVEKIYIASPIPGATYTITVSHKGTLRSGSQDYSLIVTGITTRTPLISFFTRSMSSTETPTAGPLAGDCRAYTDVSIAVRITKAPSVDNTVALLFGGSAVRGVDYDVVGSSTLVFPAGSLAVQNIVLRLYDDYATEASETISISLNITAGDASLGSYPVMTLTLLDNDPAPILPNLGGVLLREDFEAGGGGWSIATAGVSSVNTWRVGNRNLITGTRSAYVSRANNSSSYNKNDDASVLLVSPVIDATTMPYNDLQLSFNMLCNGERVGGTFYDYGLVAIVNEGISTIQAVIGGPYQGITTSTAQTISIPAQFKGTRFRIAFWWVNDNFWGSDPAFVVDDIQVQALPFAGTPVQYNVSANPAGNTYYFGPNDTLYVRDSNTGNLMVRLENLSSHDYGCTRVYVDRAGTGASNFIDTNPANAATDKTLRIIPANNNPTGSYRIRLYFLNTEIAGWETVTGKSFTTDMQIVKYPGAIASASNPSLVSYASSLQRGNYGFNAQWIEGTLFNGFSGFAGQGGGFVPLPVELLSLQAQWTDKQRVALRWEVADDTHISEYWIERSTKDNQDFVRVAERRADKAASRSANGKVYEVMDDVGNMPIGEVLYYRLGMKTTDGKLSYSAVVTPGARTFDFAVYPTVVSGNVTIELPYLSEEVQIQCIDIHGRSFDIERVSLSGEGKRIITSMEHLPKGVYVLQLRYSNGQVLQKKIVKL